MAMGPFSAFQQALNSGLVPQPPELSATGRARDRMRRAEGQRTKREVSEQARYAAASRHVDKVANTDLRAAREMSERARSTPNAGIIEPHSKPRIYGEEPVGAYYPRRASYDAVQQYRGQLRRILDWNNLMNKYQVPLPQFHIDPEKNQAWRDASRSAYPEQSLRQLYLDSDGSLLDEWGMRSEPPITSSAPAYQVSMPTGVKNVYMGGEAPWTIDQSPYSLSQFSQAMKSRFK